MNKFKIYFPNDGDCKWLDCIKKGYNQFEGYCSGHRIQGKELGEYKQCGYYDKNGLCLVKTKELFNKRFYCDKHIELLKGYDEEVKKQVKILQEKDKSSSSSPHTHTHHNS